jgi:hypothetical protein
VSQKIATNGVFILRFRKIGSDEPCVTLAAYGRPLS